MQNNQVAIRYDRASNDKGGTMISFPQHMRPCNRNRFTCNGIECVATTLLLPNAKCLQVALLYRSPSVPLQQLIIMLSTVLNYVSMSNTPTVILGDFNHVLDQPESPVINLLSTHGYTQLVNSPTTAQSTLIDHVYSNLHNNINVKVRDTYCSDHDTVYCSIPM